MTFISFDYFVFLFLLAIFFFIAKKPNQKKVILLTGSLIFIFFFNWLSLVVALFMCVINYLLLRKLQKINELQIKEKIYFLGITFNAATLFIYKFIQYLFVTYKPNLLQGIGNVNLAMLGLSFYSLQIIGFYFEIYKRRASFDYSLVDFSLSVLFFSKLPSGPILKINESIFQQTLYNNKIYEADLTVGFQRILLGVIKKVALADRLGPYVNNVFDKHAYLNGMSIYIGPIIFTIQLYLDFSALMDIAIGTARVFGIRLPENFNLPLRATSIKEFWRRWHISLVNWLTNYIFYPISFRYRKLKQKGLVIAIVCTFLISAAWHGLTITFFIWAFCHFLYIIFESLFVKKNSHINHRPFKIKRLIQVLIVWHLVSFSNIFFRAKSLQDVSLMFHDIIQLPFLYGEGLTFKTWLINGGQDIEQEFNFRFSVFLCLLFLVFEKKINNYVNSEKYNVFYVAIMIVFFVAFGIFDSAEQFIYLQF